MKQEADNEIVALNEALENICRSMQGSRYRFDLRSRYSSVGSPTPDEDYDDSAAGDDGEAGSTHSSTREKPSPPTNASVATDHLADALSDDGTGTSHVMRNLGTLEHIYRVLVRTTNSNKFEVKRPEKFMERSVAVATKFVPLLLQPVRLLPVLLLPVLLLPVLLPVLLPLLLLLLLPVPLLLATEFDMGGVCAFGVVAVLADVCLGSCARS